MSGRPETLEEAISLWTDRPEPLAEVVPYYDHDFSKHPDHIRVSFADGSTAVYDLRMDQPHPIITVTSSVRWDTPSVSATVFTRTYTASTI